LAGAAHRFLLNLSVDKHHFAGYVVINLLVEEEQVMVDRLSDMFAALADPTRRDIVSRLAAADATVGELAEPYAMSMQAISKHLKVLEASGLITKTPDAQRRTVHLEAEVFDLMSKWIERYRRQAERRYQRLDAVLAELNNQSGPAAGLGGPKQNRNGKAS
jgi:DNA-binding transcriptional ArsR family regulator